MASTMQTERIKWQLRQSMGEELSAGSIYMVRAIEAKDAGDNVTATLYEELAHDELDDHYNKLVHRLNGLGSFETMMAYNPQR